MKPDWKYAPEWANWLAMDADQEWFWFENKPVFESGIWRRDGGRCTDAGWYTEECEDSLESKP